MSSGFQAVSGDHPRPGSTNISLVPFIVHANTWFYSRFLFVVFNTAPGPPCASLDVLPGSLADGTASKGRMLMRIGTSTKHFVGPRSMPKCFNGNSWVKG